MTVNTNRFMDYQKKLIFVINVLFQIKDLIQQSSFYTNKRKKEVIEFNEKIFVQHVNIIIKEDIDWKKGKRNYFI